MRLNHVRRSVPLLATIAVLGVGACSTPDHAEGSADTVAPDVEAITAATASPTPDDDATESPVSQRGNLIKEVGETAGLLDREGGEPWMEFRITDIEVDGECTGPYPDPPENGHFVIVSLAISTGSQWPEDWDDFTIDISASDWSVIGPDGLTQSNLDTFASYSCLAERDELPYSIGRGENVVGKIVLDTSADTGILVYKPWYGGGVTGWEWEY